jgi:DNA gyrase/topoisomerase IV subunit B
MSKSNYQKNTTTVLTDREHVLSRTQMYLGSTDVNIEKKFVLTSEGKIKFEEVEYVPALVKMVCEIINNSIDENIRTHGEFANIIDIKISNNGEVCIRDNGRGIPSEIEKKSKLPSPVVCVTELKAGGNFEHDDVAKTQGTFGVGSACTNIMSSKFRLNTFDGKLQTIVHCSNNMSNIEWEQHKDYIGNPFTDISFNPDFSKLNCENFTKYEIAILKKYLLDSSICYPGITFYFNDTLISCSSFNEYVKYYTTDAEIFEFKHCKIAVFPGYENITISSVNGLHTHENGTHVTHVMKNIVDGIRKKYSKKYSMAPNDIYSNMHFIILMNDIISPKFSSQTKEKLSTAVSKMKYAYEDIKWHEIITKICKNKNIMNTILQIYKLKEDIKKKKELANKEREVSKVMLIPKLIEPAIKNPYVNRLYLSEGDSALNKFARTKSDFMGGFPLRGKFISCWNRSAHRMMENAEVFTLCKILGLKLSDPDISKSKYAEICIMSDQDVDGFHIATLLTSFIYKFWPDFFKQGKVFRAISPLIILEDNTIFYSLSSFQKYQQITDENVRSPMKMYNKGLGSLSTEDYEKMINTLQPITLDDNSYESLRLAFSKHKSNDRKLWLM